MVQLQLSLGRKYFTFVAMIITFMPCGKASPFSSDNACVASLHDGERNPTMIRRLVSDLLTYDRIK